MDSKIRTYYYQTPMEWVTWPVRWQVRLALLLNEYVEPSLELLKQPASKLKETVHHSLTTITIQPTLSIFSKMA